jgi:hypothetical protein
MRPPLWLLPRPHALFELLAAEVEARLALERELPLDHGLRGDAGVVDARLPQRVAAAHARRAHEHVLDRA